MKVVSINNRLDRKKLDDIIDVLDGMYQELENCYEALDDMEESTQAIEIAYRQLLDKYKGPELPPLYYEYALAKDDVEVSNEDTY